MNNRYLVLTLIVLSVFLFAACDDDPALPDNVAVFETEALGFEGSEMEIKIMLTRAVQKDVTLAVALMTEHVRYGEDFTTTPDGSSGTITLTIPAGNAQVSFKVNKPTDIFLNGDERITFTIASADNAVVLGENIAVALSFSAITSEGSQLQLLGKTDASNYANSVYVDMSANQQTLVDRKSWNLGFYNGDLFRVILNPGYQSTIAPLTKTDIHAVTLADADAVPNLNHDPTDVTTKTLADDWNGDLNSTAIGEVSSTDNDNHVYLLSFEGSKEKELWYKLKVTRNGTGYRIHYARIGETTIKTIDVAKNAAFNFTFVSLTSNSIVTVEPEKANWDIEWSYSTVNSGYNTPYWGQDFVLLNYVAGAEAAEIVKAGAADAETAYTSFGKADLTGITWLKTRDAIGTKWRTTGGPGGGATGIKRDRFYVIKDPRGNIYKLRFVTMGLGSDGGERGKPVIEYKLVKKAG